MKSLLKNLLILGITFLSFTATAQNKMRSLEELINTTDPAWPLIQKWADSAKNKVEIMEVDSASAKTTLFNTQVTTFSTLGAVVYNSGGIMVDNGWLRILGSGSPRLNRSVSEWNKGKSIKEFGEVPPYFLIADDAIGGFFAINYGAFGQDLKAIYYLAPNSLEWESIGLGYTEFLRFCFDGDLSAFYKGLRWSSWDKFIAKLDGSKSYSFSPYLWTKEGMDIEKCKRKLVPTEELYQFVMSNQREINQKPPVEPQ